MKCKNVPAILNKLINNERWFADNHLQQVVEFTFSDRRLNWRTDSGSPISDFFPYDDFTRVQAANMAKWKVEEKMTGN